MSDETSEPSLGQTPVIKLAEAKGGSEIWGKSIFEIVLWAICEIIFVTNPWQISSGVRVFFLKLFGAKIGQNVTFRQRTRVKYPWKLEIGDDCWIGEGVWFHNQDLIRVGSNVVISQESMLTTGSHSFRANMDLIISPITIDDGVWITSRCMILAGVTVGRSAVICPMTVVRTDVPENVIFSSEFDASNPSYRFQTNHKKELP